MDDDQPINVIAVLNRVVTAQDGGGKITFEFGNDSLPSVQALQKLAANHNKAFVLVAAPFDSDEIDD